MAKLDPALSAARDRLSAILLGTPEKIEVCENGRVYGACRSIECPEHQTAVENMARYGMEPYEHWHVLKESDRG